MDSVDLEVLKRSAEWIDDGRRVLLVTVVKTWGSSPRPEGAMLAVREDGLVVGSVSGGCIEDDIVDRTRRDGQKATRCEVVTYGVTADEARRFGLPCGGTIQLVLEPLTREPKLDDLALMEALKSPAFYVGALGSRANNAKRRERLREFDVSEEEIARLHGPIGLYIASRTPPEIAVSILAEITAIKNGVGQDEILPVAVAKEKHGASVACATS